MSCKPGDLAVVINDVPAENIGRLVVVLRATSERFDDDSRFHWKVQAVGARPLLGLVYADGQWTGEIDEIFVTNIADVDLRPIRPGDITDESVRDLYQPAPTKELA